MKHKFPAIAAVVFGVISLVGIQAMNKTAPVRHEVAMVLVAKKSLEAGKAITRDDLELQPMARQFFSPARGFLTDEDRGMVLGRMVSKDVAEGSIILRTDLRNEGSLHLESLVDLIPAGMRAISIPIENRGGVSSFLNPGYSVDILATLDVPEQRQTEMSIPDQGFYTHTEVVMEPRTLYLLEDVKLLAVGDRISRDTAGSRGSGGSITIAVTPEEAQKLSFATGSGSKRGGQSVSFQVVLRRSGDTARLDSPRAVDYRDVLEMTSRTSN